MGGCGSRGMVPSVDMAGGSTDGRTPPLEAAHNHFYDDGGTGSLDIKKFALRFGFAENPFLSQIGQLFDKGSGAEVGFREFVQVMGTLGYVSQATPESTLKHAEVIFIWRIMNFEGRPKVSADEVLKLVKTVYASKVDQPQTKGMLSSFKPALPKEGLELELAAREQRPSPGEAFKVVTGHPLFNPARDAWAFLSRYARPCMKLLVHCAKANLVLASSRCMDVFPVDISAIIKSEARASAKQRPSFFNGKPPEKERDQYSLDQEPKELVGKLEQVLKAANEADKSARGGGSSSKEVRKAGSVKKSKGSKGPEGSDFRNPVGASAVLSTPVGHLKPSKTILEPLAATPPKASSSTFTKGDLLKPKALQSAEGKGGSEKKKKQRVGIAAKHEKVDVPSIPKAPGDYQLIENAVWGNPLFEAVEEDMRSRLILSMAPQSVAAGTTIVEEGDERAEQFYVVHRGQCEVLKGQLSVADLHAGASFGELALVYSCARAASVVAVTDCDLWVLERAVYATVCEEGFLQLQEHKLSLLEGVPIFKGLTEEHLQVVRDALTVARFADGEHIMRKGDQGDAFYIVARGEVTVRDHGMILATVAEGGFFGERALINNDVRAADVVASGEATCMTLDRATFLSVLGPLEETKKWGMLRSCPLLAILDNDQVEECVGLLKQVTFEAGQAVFGEGDSGDCAYFVQQGECLVSVAGGQAREVKAGASVGTEGLLGVLRTASAAASQYGALVLWRLDARAVEARLGALAALQREWRRSVLRRVPLFSQLSPERLERLCDAIQDRAFMDREIIVKSGEKSSQFYIVESGRVGVYDAQGRQIGEQGKSSYFGELALLRDVPRAATIVSVGVTMCGCLSKKAFDSILSKVKDQMMAIADERYPAAVEDENAKMSVKSMAEVTKLAVLGTGGFGLVSLVKVKGKVLAMKSISMRQVVASGLEKHVKLERDIGMMLDCPFLVTLRGTLKDEWFLYMFLEPVMGGELFGYLERASIGNRGIQESEARFFAACVVYGLEYLHQRQLCYRDLKPENCLIDNQGYLKITDFGFVKKVTDRTYTICGTMDYMAPEILTRKGHNREVDIWALGVLIFEMTTHKTPFHDLPDDTAHMNAVRKAKFTCPSFLSSDCTDIVKKLMNPTPAKRLGCTKDGPALIRRHKWFSQLDWDALEKRTIKPKFVPKISSPTDCSNMEALPDDMEHPGLHYENGGSFPRDDPRLRSRFAVFDDW